MLNVHRASQLILQSATLSKATHWSIYKAVGKILREDICADRAYPPFNKSLMDGIAISLKVLNQGQRTFKIEKIIPAGMAPYKLKNLSHCVQIMTGAVVPNDCDCVIPIEQLNIKNGNATVLPSTQSKGQMIRKKGSDIKQGAIVLKKGIRLTPAHIGVIASVGRKDIVVASPLKIAVISTGDELVDVGQSLKPYQTRISNAYALKAAFESTALAEVTMFHFKDDKKILTKGIAHCLKNYDSVVLSGGVSQGDFDFIPEILKDLKVSKIFHGINQKPGKPFWFGKSLEQKPIFALPGNPASTLVCAYRYIIPFLYKKAGTAYLQAYVTVPYICKHPSISSVFVPIKNNGIMSHGGSGDFISWAKSDGFIEYDKQQKDNLRPYFSWRL